MLNFFSDQEFKEYWFSTATPDFLAQLAKRRQINNFDEVKTTFNAFESFDVERVNLQALFFQNSSEANFHSLVHVVFSLLGVFIESEVNTSAGRIDSVVQTPEYVYILEFKLNGSVQSPLDQIKDRGYAQTYRSLPKTIVGVGINFSGKLKNIDEWVQETI